MKTSTIPYRSICLLLATIGTSLAQRPPAVPLVSSDPYFSIWSMADQLNAENTRHWTGTPQSMTSMIRIDGTSFRLMGAERNDKTPALPQKNLEVTLTQSIYKFEGSGMEATLTFTSPRLPHDLDVLSWPVTYLTWSLRSTDGKNHAAQIYFDASSDIAVNTPTDQAVNWSHLRADGLRVMRVGSREQPVLAKSGDNLRIDWGYFYVSTPNAQDAKQAVNDRAVSREAFLSGGQVPAEDAFAEHNPRVRTNAVRNPVMAVSFDLGSVTSTPVSRFVVLAYDDLYSLEYFNRRVRPYWRRKGAEASDLLRAATTQYEQIIAKCNQFDRDLMADLTRAGGKEYAQLAALSYRQSMAAHKLAVDVDGTALFFSKENFSNGSINTVDVFYPSAPPMRAFVFVGES